MASSDFDSLLASREMVLVAGSGGVGKTTVAAAMGLAAVQRQTGSVLVLTVDPARRLATALGANPLTLMGLAGLGDLVATCSSPLSRNRTFGERIGRGESLAQAEAANHGQVAEGVKSCLSICELGERHGVELPIADAVRRVCHEGYSAREMAKELISRAPKAE